MKCESAMICSEGFVMNSLTWWIVSTGIHEREEREKERDFISFSECWWSHKI